MAGDYCIFCFAGEPIFDALPVMKVTHFEGAGGGYTPFAQGQLCARESGLTARLWAFEAKPEPGSALCLLLRQSGALLRFSALAGGEAALSAGGAACTLPFSVRRLAGEDLQGEYWGAELTLPPGTARALGLDLRPGAEGLAGNLLKLGGPPKPHFGAFAPAPDREAPAAVFSLALF